MANKKNSAKNSGVRQRTHERVDKIMDRADSITQKGKNAMTAVKDKVIAMKENAEGYICKNPEKSVLIAAGIGAVAGTVLTAAMTRRKHLD